MACSVSTWASHGHTGQLPNSSTSCRTVSPGMARHRERSLRSLLPLHAVRAPLHYLRNGQTPAIVTQLRAVWGECEGCRE